MPLRDTQASSWLCAHLPLLYNYKRSIVSSIFLRLTSPPAPLLSLSLVLTHTHAGAAAATPKQSATHCDTRVTAVETDAALISQVGRRDDVDRGFYKLTI